MDSSEPIQLDLGISISDFTNEELDDATRELFKELKQHSEVESIRLGTAKAPEGTKAIDPVTAGAIALAVLPTMLPKVLDFLQSWSLQGKGRTIKFKGKLADQSVEFEGSFAEMEKMVALLEQKGKKGKKK